MFPHEQNQGQKHSKPREDVPYLCTPGQSAAPQPLRSRRGGRANRPRSGPPRQPRAHSPSARPQPHSRQAQIARDGPRARRGGSSRCSSGPDLGVAELHHHILAAPARRHLKPPQQRPDAGLGGPGKGAGAEGCACALRAATSRGGRWGL